MKNGYVLIYDSGNGGQYVLDLFRKLLPNEHYLLFKDTSNCPYGNKSREELKKIFFSNIYKLSKKYPLKVIVIACNTLSSMFGHILLRQTFLPKIFLIKPIINSKMLTEHTLLMATENTCKYNRDIMRFRQNPHLHILSLASFAKDIDDNIGNISSLEREVHELLSPYLDFDIKNVVIGCTHYNYLRKIIKNAVKNVEIYEKSQFIVQKTIKYLIDNDLLSNKKKVKILQKI